MKKVYDILVHTVILNLLHITMLHYSVCNLILEEDATKEDEQFNLASDSKMRPDTNLVKLFT